MNYIYRITNLINDKVYIGQHTWGGDGLDPKYFCSSLNPHFYRAIEKYGKENFRQEIIEVVDNKSELNERETYWIQKYFGENCYNLQDKAHSWNVCHTPEVQEKAHQTDRERHGGKLAIQTDESREKALQTLRDKYDGDCMGMCHTEVARQKALQIKREKYDGDVCGMFHTEDARKKAYQKNRDNHGGKLACHTKEVREKINETNRREFNWYFNGELIYVGKKNIAKRLMHKRNQTWIQGEEVMD